MQLAKHEPAAHLFAGIWSWKSGGVREGFVV
jgi:hypothetical protein